MAVPPICRLALFRRRNFRRLRRRLSEHPARRAGPQSRRQCPDGKNGRGTERRPARSPAGNLERYYPQTRVDLFSHVRAAYRHGPGADRFSLYGKLSGERAYFYDLVGDRSAAGAADRRGAARLCPDPIPAVDLRRQAPGDGGVDLPVYYLLRAMGGGPGDRLGLLWSQDRVLGPIQTPRENSFAPSS